VILRFSDVLHAAILMCAAVSSGERTQSCDHAKVPFSKRALLDENPRAIRQFCEECHAAAQMLPQSAGFAETV
jgi:hypothetical protein